MRQIVRLGLGSVPASVWGAGGWIQPRQCTIAWIGLAALVVFGSALGAPAEAGVQEVFYLACSNQELEEPIDGDNDNIVTMLYEVTFDEGTNEAILTEIATSPLNQADAIACSQEGKCYIVDRFLENHPDLEEGGFIEEYDVAIPGPPNISGSKLIEFTDGGFPNPLQGLVLASFHPDGTLYGASQDQDLLWTIDLDLPDMANPEADPVGATGAVLVDGVPLDIEGADIVFTADHRMFLWTNGIDPGLYELTLPPDDLSDTTAVKLDSAVGVPAPNFATGLAARENGAGNVVMSSTIDEITEHSLADDGLLVETFSMVGEPGFDHESGDMANLFDCLMRCAVTPSLVMPGERMDISLELFHNRAKTVDQQFELELVNSVGEVVYAASSASQRLAHGDRLERDFGFTVPDSAPAGSYSVRFRIEGMQQGEAAAECGFEIGAAPGE